MLSEGIHGLVAGAPCRPGGLHLGAWVPEPPPLGAKSRPAGEVSPWYVNKSEQTAWKLSCKQWRAQRRRLHRVEQLALGGGGVTIMASASSVVYYPGRTGTGRAGPRRAGVAAAPREREREGRATEHRRRVVGGTSEAVLDRRSTSVRCRAGARHPPSPGSSPSSAAGWPSCSSRPPARGSRPTPVRRSTLDGEARHGVCYLLVSRRCRGDESNRN